MSQPSEKINTPSTKTAKKLKIGLVTETFPPDINGVANTLSHLADGLIAHGHTIQLIRPKPREQDARDHHYQLPEQIEEVLITGLPIPGYQEMQFGLPELHSINKAWQRFKPDVLYIATEGPLGFSALQGAKFLGIPALTGMHTNFHEYSDHYGIGLFSKAIHTYLRWFHNSSGGTLVPTNQMASSLVDQEFKKVETWPRGVDAERFHPAKRSNELRQSWGVEENDPVMLYVGRLAPEKNIELVLKAFRFARQHHPRTQCILVGSGPLQTELAREYPEAKFVGPKTGEDLSAHYASGDLFVFPSLTETFGNVVLEALASGVPVLAFDHAAASQLIKNDVNGILIEAANSAAFITQAKTLMDRRTELAQWREAARKTAESQSWTELVKRFENILYDLVEKGEMP